MLNSHFAEEQTEAWRGGMTHIEKRVSEMNKTSGPILKTSYCWC